MEQMSFGCSPSSQRPVLATYRVYGKVDSRFVNDNVLVFCVQGLTALLDTPLCLLLIYAIINAKPWRHAVQIVLSVAQAYGASFLNIIRGVAL